LQPEDERRCRKHPAKGVLYIPGEPTVVFVTTCTKGRAPWLAREPIHVMLRAAWAEADAWLVGRYVIMPDHVHLFAAPGPKDIDIERWVGYWKSIVSMGVKNLQHRWQRECWHHRLRSSESYEEKWEYVRDNPVRKGLVEKADDWPFQGEIETLFW
jgi:REP-associated tyrosine transposase